MTGHIRRRGERSWELKFDAGIDPLTGKRETKYYSVKGTRRDAQAKLVELLSEAAKGTLLDRSKETLGSFLARWDRDWAVNNVSPKTAERYRQLIVNQIQPHIGVLPLQRLRASNLAEFYATLSRSGGVDSAPLGARTGPRSSTSPPRPRACRDLGPYSAEPGNNRASAARSE
jgi:integrase